MNSFWNRIPPVTKNLLIINIIVWLAMIILPSSFDAAISRSCALHYLLSPNFKAWQPLTYMFMHSTMGISHLLFNMFGVVMFGSVLEQVFGSRRYLFFYLTVGLGAAFVQEGVYAIWLNNLSSSLPADMTLSEIASEGNRLLNRGMTWSDPTLAQANMLLNTPTVGASGALYGVLLGFAMLFPNMPLYLFFIPIPIKAKWMVLGYGVIELFFGITGLQAGVAHFAHLGGMIVALILILYWRKKGEINSGPLY